jgi:probable HAF family extracellular repeat protein
MFLPHKIVVKFLVIFALSTLLGGCGFRLWQGRESYPGSSSGSANLTIRVNWPQTKHSERLIPQAAQSIVVILYQWSFVGDLKEIARTNPPIQRPQTTYRFTNIPSGITQIVAIAYPNPDGSGTPLARGEVEFALVPGENQAPPLTMDSTIVKVEVSPPEATLSVGETLQLTATAKDADGNIILVPEGGFSWQSSNPTVAEVDSSGKVTAKAEGSATITATEKESQKSGNATVNVTKGVYFWVIEPHFGRNGTIALGVSDDGSVVVGRSVNVSNTTDVDWWPFGRYIDPDSFRAFYWTSISGTQDLGSFGVDTTCARAVSSDGKVIVGECYIGSYAWHPFRWTAQTGMQDLGTFGTDWSAAWDVSADGSVVAGYSYGDCGFGYWGTFPWRWTAQTGLTCLGTLPGYKFAEAQGISADGSVVVGTTYRDWAPYWDDRQAWIWTANSGIKGLGLLPPWGSSAATSVSGDGSTVIGWLFNNHGYEHLEDYPFRAFRWRADTGMIDLGTLGGERTRVWHAVTWDGSVVFGTSQTSSGEWHAFRWTPRKGMEDLNAVYSSLIPQGWVLGDVYDCSSDGRFLVGWARGPGGIIRAYLLDTSAAKNVRKR